ncbi:MAG: nucleotidyl transferase AbiEii/AbiGii toxin family protein [Planctomycetes bacterium]|nr:nucleotidyl transferase AbiEii/AbiGii toxin family protein [Planctomycetota bacterium]
MRRSAAARTGDARLETIKRLAVISVFSVDDYLDRLVLKGGNALDLVHGISTRSSTDVDLSMSGCFSPEERPRAAEKLTSALAKTFRTAGFEVFDLTMEDKPASVSPDVADFWGGYEIVFKIASSEIYREFAGDIEALRRRAESLESGRKFHIEISKHEWVDRKQAKYLDGYRVFVYSPAMMIAEKLRAICQQMPEYGAVVHRTRPGGARARDFVDIHTVATECSVDMTMGDQIDLIRRVFHAKRVPPALLASLASVREVHRNDFAAVRATVKPGVSLKEYDFYFDFVIDLATRLLKPLGNV